MQESCWKDTCLPSKLPALHLSILTLSPTSTTNSFLIKGLVQIKYVHKHTNLSHFLPGKRLTPLWNIMCHLYTWGHLWFRAAGMVRWPHYQTQCACSSHLSPSQAEGQPLAPPRCPCCLWHASRNLAGMLPHVWRKPHTQNASNSLALFETDGREAN